MKDQVREILENISMLKQQRDGNDAFTDKQKEYANLSEEEIFNRIEELRKKGEDMLESDEEFDLVMGALNGLHKRGNDEIQKTEDSYKNTLEGINRGKSSIIELYKQYEQDAIKNKDFASANKYKDIYTQIESAYSLDIFKNLIEKKPNVCKISDELMDEFNTDAFNKNKEKLDRRLSKINKFKFDPVNDIMNNLANALVILGRDDNEIKLLQCFILQQFNFLSVNNKKYFVSKFFFNIKALTNSQILDKQMEGFKNSLLEVLENIVKINS